MILLGRILRKKKKQVLYYYSIHVCATRLLDYFEPQQPYNLSIMNHNVKLHHTFQRLVRYLGCLNIYNYYFLDVDVSVHIRLE
jgi:hypothetical protein